MISAVWHGLLPALLLLLIPVAFATPLWVARAFVPDVYITVMLSAALLVIGGLIKGGVLYRRRRRPSAA